MPASPTCCSSRRSSTSARSSPCCAATIPVHGLAHITGGGLLNLLRLGSGIGFEITAPLPVPAVFALIAELGEVSPAEMWEVFNMGCGFCVVVPRSQDADAAVIGGSPRAPSPGTAVIGDAEAGARVARAERPARADGQGPAWGSKGTVRAAAGR